MSVQTSYLCYYALGQIEHDREGRGREGVREGEGGGGGGEGRGEGGGGGVKEERGSSIVLL